MLSIFSLRRKTARIHNLSDLFRGGAVAVGTRQAVPGPGRETIIDSGGNLAIDATQQRLAVAGGTAAWNDPSLWATFDATTFGAAAVLVRLAGASNAGPALILHSAANANPTSAGMGLHFETPQWSPAGGSASYLVSKPDTRVRAIDYMLIVVRRAGGGAIVAISGGVYGVFPSATLVWLYDSDSIAATAYVGLTNNAGAWRAKQLRDAQLSHLPAALTTRYGMAAAADTFTRADASLSGSSTEVGALTWAIFGSGGANIVSNKATTITAQWTVATVPLATVPNIIEVSVTTPASGAIWAGVVFRGDNSTNNCLIFRLEAAVWRLEKRTGASGGTGTTINQSAFSTAFSTTYRLRVIDYGTSMRLFIDGVEAQIGGVSDTTLNTQTHCGFTRAATADNGSTFDNFAAYGAITLPTELGPFTAPPVGTGAATITDTFTGTDGTALATYNAAYTTFSSGSWQINSNKARMTAAATQGYAVRDTGLNDHEVSVDITLPAAPGGSSPDWFIGVVARCADASNFVFARYLYQSNSPEVEVFQTVAGVATLMAFVNLGTSNLLGGTTHTLRVAVKGREVAAYHDGELVAQGFTDVTSGTKAGFGVDANTTGQPTFDNLSIKAI